MIPIHATYLCFSPAQHVEHLVAANSQKGRPHSLDVGGVNTSEPDELLGLADHLVGPGLLVEVGSKAVGDSVRGHLVTIGVQVLDLGIVCPLVGHVEGRLDRATVRIVSLREEILVKLLVQIVDGIIEGQEDKLGDLVRTVTAGNVSSSAIAILDNENKLVFDIIKQLG